MADQKEFTKRLRTLLKHPDNKTCCDCYEKRPTWAALIKPIKNAPFDSKILGVFVCYSCAGVHRSLGTHISYVRSVGLDDCK
jgi:hypothetical protein